MIKETLHNDKSQYSKTKQPFMCSHLTTSDKTQGGKWIEFQGEVDKSVIIIRDFNTPL